MRTAIIDLGTNTFNLLVVELGDKAFVEPRSPRSVRDDERHSLHIIHSEELPVFLGRGGIEQGVITPDAFARGIAALQAHAATARQHGAERFVGFGTSMLRNARNAGDFIVVAREQCGVGITVIKGGEEAELILEGVRLAVPFSAKPALVMDIGGGSIEFILATNKALMWKRSSELGVTRMRDRFRFSDPMTTEEQFRLADHFDAQLEPLWNIIERHEPHELIGSAGSFDSLAAMVCAARGEALDPATTSVAFTALEFDALKDKLLGMTREERLRVPGLPEHRADTIAIALIAIERVLIAGGIRDLRWSKYALKEGAAVRLTSPPPPDKSGL
jgi:exopolyphosphatase/guanosine-5'-triphosphate,3'-diphosphate pyrophosphatase